MPGNTIAREIQKANHISHPKRFNMFFALSFQKIYKRNETTQSASLKIITSCSIQALLTINSISTQVTYSPHQLLIKGATLLPLKYLGSFMIPDCYSILHSCTTYTLLTKRKLKLAKLSVLREIIPLRRIRTGPQGVILSLVQQSQIVIGWPISSATFLPVQLKAARNQSSTS